MRRSFGKAFVVLALAAVGTAGCDKDENGSPTGPTPTPTVTETFTGTLSKNGGVTFSFSVSASGQVSATLRELNPAPAVGLGLSLGNWNGTVCQTVLANDNAIQGTFVTGNMTRSGDLCVRIYDSTGSLEQTVAFRIDVVHP
jgi:hypothetical protein